MLNNSVEIPDGAVRILLSTEKAELKLPRELNFVVEPLILEGSSAPFLLAGIPNVGRDRPAECGSGNGTVQFRVGKQRGCFRIG